MEKNISSFDDLIQFFPEVVQKSSNEWASACPFCPPTEHGEKVKFGDHLFVGNDRLIWWVNGQSPGFYCRRCGEMGRGITGHGWYPFAFVVQFFGLKLSENFQFTASEGVVEKPIVYWNLVQVLQAHAQVQRPYWNNFGWDEAAIDRFHLGYGVLYPMDGAANLIPMEIRTANEESSPNSFVIEARANGQKKQSRGSKKNYFWHVADSDTSAPIVLTEGAKDAISAWTLGFKNFVVSFGTTVWSFEKTKYLANRGYRTLYVFGDNDPAGQIFNNKVSRWATLLGLDVYVLTWGEDKALKYDVTDLLAECGVDVANQYIIDHLQKQEYTPPPPPTRPIRIDDYTEIKPDYVADTPHPLPIDAIRDVDHPASLMRFIEEFLEEFDINEGALLAAPTGVGKTHMMLQVVEKFVREKLQLKIVEKQKLLSEIDYVENLLTEITDPDALETNRFILMKLREMLERFSFASAMWSSQYKLGWNELVNLGADSELWFNFEARNGKNCENFEVVTKLGENNHDIGHYCQIACPFRDRCKQQGYLSQEEKRKQKPIVFTRHEHLLNKEIMQDYRDLLVIDESPLHILNRRVMIGEKDLLAHNDNWVNELDEGTIAAINFFIAGVKKIINDHRNVTQETGKISHILYGAAVLKKLDEAIHELSENTSSLADVANLVDDKILSAYYQPTFLGDNVSNVLPRTTHLLLRVIHNELPDFNDNPEHTQPSSLFLVNDTSPHLEIYVGDKLHIRRRTPLLVADATVKSDVLYEGFFNRTLRSYKPEAFNSNARTIMITGSDIGPQLDSTMGKEIRDNALRPGLSPVSIIGEEFDLDSIPMTTAAYENPFIIRMKAMLKLIVEQHPSVLIITYKKIEHIMRAVFAADYPDLANRCKWGHYGAMRGTNEYKDFEAVVLLGVFRMPYEEVWKQGSALARLLGIKSTLPFDLVYIPDPYHMQNCGYYHITFSNNFLREYVDFIEEGELNQCAGRIRAHVTDRPKFTYGIMSRPGLPYITDVYTQRQFIAFVDENSKLNQIRDRIINDFNYTLRIPSYAKLRRDFGVGNRVIRQAFLLASQEVDLPILANRRQ